MKIDNLLAENITSSSNPDQGAGGQAPKFGRSEKFLEDETIEETTTSGAIATNAAPVGGMQRRGKGSIFSGIKTSKKFANSDAAGVTEGSKDEQKIQPELKKEMRETSDASGMMHAARHYNKSFIITAELAEGGTKKYRIHAQSERVAREKFSQHYNMAKVLNVEEEGVAEEVEQIDKLSKIPAITGSSQFDSFRVGRLFSFKGKDYVKQSTRTARLLSNGQVFIIGGINGYMTDPIPWESAFGTPHPASRKIFKSEKAAKARANSGQTSVAEGADPTEDRSQEARGDHRGEVKKNKNGSYVATNQTGSRKIFKSKHAAKAHANSGQTSVAEGLLSSTEIYDQIESLRKKLNHTNDPDARRFYIKKIKDLEHKLHSSDDPFDIDDGAPISKQGVAEGLEQVFKVVALNKSDALKKPTKLNVKASSIEEVFERLAANDWYALSINGVEVIAGKRLKQGVAEGLSEPTRKVFFKVIKTQGTGMPSGYRRVKTMRPLEDGGFYIELSTPGYGMDYTRHNYKNFSLKDDQGKPITGQEANNIINGKQGVAEAKADPLGAWIAHKNGTEAKQFKTREGAKKYVASHEGFTINSSERFHDTYRKKKDIAENSIDESEISENDLILKPGISKRLKPGFVSKADNRIDREVEMALVDLKQANKNSKSIYLMLKDVPEEEGIAGWVQEKIIKASDYLKDVKEYLEGPEVSSEGIAGAIAGGVAGVALTKSPSGMMAGISLGDKVQDAFESSSTKRLFTALKSKELNKNFAQVRQDYENRKKEQKQQGGDNANKSITGR